MSDDADHEGAQQPARISRERLRSFFDAIKPGAGETIRRRLARGIPVDAERNGDDDGWTALHTAALRGADDVVAVLLEHGADPNKLTGQSLRFARAPDAKGSTPLESAAYAGNSRCITLLLDAGARDGAAEALARAARKQHWDAVRVLVERGVEPNYIEDELSRPALVECIAGDAPFELVKALVDGGAHVNLPEERWYQPLATATGMGRLDVVKLLLDAGADVNAREGDAIARAVGRDNVELLELLLARGARLEHASVIDAAGAGAARSLAFLIARGAAVDVLGHDRKNALTWSLERGHDECERLLRAAGVPEQPEHAAAIAEERAKQEQRAHEERAKREELARLGVEPKPGKVIDGPFANFSGTGYVDESGRVKVSISIFGRQTEIVVDARQFKFDGESA